MKKINVFYVWGVGGSPESSTVEYLQEALGEKYNVISDFYAQYNPVEAISDLTTYIKDKKIDLIVGSSLGAFISLQLPNIPKILINTCLHPETELEKLTTDVENPETHEIETVKAVPEHIVKFYKDYVESNNIWSNFNKDNTVFVFGDNDELFEDRFWDEIKSYSTNIVFSKQGHHNTKESIRDYVAPEIKKIFN